MNFNPPIPCGMGHTLLHDYLGAEQFQSTHPVWDGTFCDSLEDFSGKISIHPSRVGWDQSSPRCRWIAGYFNPPIPCGMGLCAKRLRELEEKISIHPSRVGWDSWRRLALGATIHFNPPIPCGMGLTISKSPPMIG